MPGTVLDPTSAGEDQYESEDQGGAQGQKYLALDVPDFTSQTGNFHSYLCLGSASEWFSDNGGRDPSHYGQMLANLVTGFCDDTRSFLATPPSPANTTNRSTLNAYEPTLAPAQGVDDNGNGETPSPTEFPVDATNQQPSTVPTPPGTTSIAPTDSTLNPMQQESALLQLKGGWRDHSDGNRITTTYGDKVEVIRGNYKLLVLGRQDWPEDPEAAPAGTQVAGWDISGGLVTNNSGDLLYPGGNNNDASWPPPRPQYPPQSALMTQYTWEQNSDGNWAWTLVTQTGSNPPLNSKLNQNQGNGRTISYTWVDEIYQYIGSALPQSSTTGEGMQNPDQFISTSSPYPVKNMVSKAWAETVVQELNAAPTLNSPTAASLTSTWTSTGDITSNTSAAGTVSTTYSAATINNTFTSSGSVTNNTAADVTGGTITNTQVALAIVNNTNALGNILTDTTALLQESFQVAALSLVGNLIGAQVQVTAGEASVSGSFFMAMVNELAALINITNWNGVVLDAHQGLHADNHAGMHIDNHSGVHLDLHTGLHLSQNTVAPYTRDLEAGELHSILGPDCHLLTQSIDVTQATQVKIAQGFMHL